MERFFSLDHFTTDRLCEMYRDAREWGNQLIEYDYPGEKGQRYLNLSPEEIESNISHELHNYIVFQEDHEMEPDRMTIAFGLLNYPHTYVYIDCENYLVEYFAPKYGLIQWYRLIGEEREYFPYSKFFTLEPMKDQKPH